MRRILLYTITTVLAGCASNNREVESMVPETPTFSLRLADPISHPKPLPLQTSVMIDWKLGEKTRTVEGFRGWDVNQDGVFDMIEVLSESGRTTGWAFDFDGDGKIDLQRAADPAESEVKSLNLSFLASSGTKADLGSSVQPQNLKTPGPSIYEAYKSLQLSH
ncbi:MAG: hypothetical protein NTV34_08245 [Proteobacteria bacterium]|nr:hypothetical protein [Pseudomonadota bacterium]